MGGWGGEIDRMLGTTGGLIRCHRERQAVIGAWQTVCLAIKDILSEEAHKEALFLVVVAKIEAIRVLAFTHTVAGFASVLGIYRGFPLIPTSSQLHHKFTPIFFFTHYATTPLRCVSIGLRCPDFSYHSCFAISCVSTMP